MAVMNALICSNWRPEFQAKHAGPALSSVTLTPTDVSQGLVWYNHSSRFQLGFGLVLKTTDVSQVLVWYNHSSRFSLCLVWYLKLQMSARVRLVYNPPDLSWGLVWYSTLQMTVWVWFDTITPTDLSRSLVWYSNYR